MLDIVRQISAIHRDVAHRTTAAGGQGISVLLRRTYDTTPADVWDAITNPERVKRWFTLLTGDLREGGKFQLKGNASGDILRCDPPRLLKLTYGGETSIVEVRLSPGDGDTTNLEVEHNVPIEMAGSGAGSLFVGPGWDGGLLGLDLYLRGQAPEDLTAAANSPEVQEFSRQSAHAWAAAVAASGTATADEIAGALQASLGHFAPDVRESPAS
ncbi:SRPBCC domain-containing protein [Nannocystis punicea]|uniref:SRPBCC domain-containing protein n=1 Tax=Nannocystis punicea TaxID=2995304 RepID=A0ABY7HFL3_9BACT|nr:SRPBCC domain-containing protein [Nannocystis poenicansa]WAS97819.1 SRPBCC domain-containing protein [Nannocystis poenicansa]